VALQISLIEDEVGFCRLEPGWNDLLQRSRANCPFLTWEWVSTWWSLYRGDSTLYLLQARDEVGRLAGLAPLKRCRRRLNGLWPVSVVEFIGHGGDVNPEYLDFIVEPERSTDVLNALVAFLREDRRVDGIDLRPLAAHSASLACLSSVFRGKESLDVSPDAACPVLALPATYESFLTGRSRNYRKKIGEAERRCARDLQIRLRTSVTPEELDRDMARLMELHLRRWNGRSAAFRTLEYIEFHRRVSQLFLSRGWTRMFSLEGATGVVACLYCYCYNRVYYYYQAGRDPAFSRNRVGLVLMHMAVREAIREGAVFFDFLRGRESYKYHWADDHWFNLRVVCWRSRGHTLAYRFGTITRTVGRRLLGRSVNLAA